jgi:hypothetical protein
MKKELDNLKQQLDRMREQQETFASLFRASEAANEPLKSGHLKTAENIKNHIEQLIMRYKQEGASVMETAIREVLRFYEKRQVINTGSLIKRTDIDGYNVELIFYDGHKVVIEYKFYY